MIELIIFFFLLILVILSGGYSLSKIIIKNQYNFFHLHELGFLGIFFYTFLSILLHFLFPLNETINLIISIIFISYFLISLYLRTNLSTIFKKKIFLIISFFVVIAMTINYKPHEDYGFYHLPYIINLVNEKIIFGLANLQAQFAWNSSWLNFSSSLYLPFMKFKGTQLSNSILFFFFLVFIFREIFLTEKKGLSFYFIIFFSFYSIIKFSRISGHGFDFPANFFLILSLYYFIKLFETDDVNLIQKYFNLLILFSSLTITIKFSTFISPLIAIFGFLVVINKKINLKKILPSIIICFIFISAWFLQQFIYSSCLVPFFEFTCDTSNIWFQTGLPQTLSEVAGGAGNKSFNEYSGSLTKEEYLENFNWLSTWFFRNKIEFLEHLAAFIIPIIILFFINLKNFKITKFKEMKLKKQTVYLYLLLITLVVFGLLIWLLKSPVIRFGIPYLFSFCFLIIFFIFKTFFKDKNLNGIGIILILCLSYNLGKNIVRISNSEYSENYFPKILKINYSQININGYKVNYPDPIEVSTQSKLCWSIPFICHIGKGEKIKITKLNNYLLIVNQKNE